MINHHWMAWWLINHHRMTWCFINHLWMAWCLINDHWMTWCLVNDQQWPDAWSMTTKWHDAWSITTKCLDAWSMTTEWPMTFINNYLWVFCFELWVYKWKPTINKDNLFTSNKLKINDINKRMDLNNNHMCNKGLKQDINKQWRQVF